MSVTQSRRTGQQSVVNRSAAANRKATSNSRPSSTTTRDGGDVGRASVSAMSLQNITSSDEWQLMQQPAAQRGRDERPSLPLRRCKLSPMSVCPSVCLRFTARYSPLTSLGLVGPP